MTKERIAIVGIIIIGIVLGRYLLKRMEIDAERANMQSRIMYVIDSADVKIEPTDSSEVLYTLSMGDSVLTIDYNENWMKVKSGGFVPSDDLNDTNSIKNY
ncbi:MAG: hypothetical protein JRE65_07515 [Deltaproteobacteria bacterium]|jgi:hypothetical protein|nr:hypothetical protein [Deltaproteobacteria bacterium]